jgi:hypothetical protein
VTIFNKRNAVVGFVALETAKRALRHRRQKRSGLKLSLYIGLGLVSLGVLAGVVAVLARRRRGVAGIDEEAASIEEAADEIIGEFVAAATEPVPTT